MISSTVAISNLLANYFRLIHKSILAFSCMAVRELFAMLFEWQSCNLLSIISTISRLFLLQFFATSTISSYDKKAFQRNHRVKRRPARRCIQATFTCVSGKANLHSPTIGIFTRIVAISNARNPPYPVSFTIASCSSAAVVLNSARTNAWRSKINRTTKTS